MSARVIKVGRGRGALGFPGGPVPRGPSAPYVMRGAEIATSLVLGTDETRTPLAAVPTKPDELIAVLTQGLVSALERSPCLVAFSGGRDSSGILAAAVSAARHHGLPLPIPITNRFPIQADADEAAWQEAVVKHLGLKDWIRVDLSDELDLVGPMAGPLLRRFGVLWPPNTHFIVPLAAHAGGGTLLTGVGGDELFLPSTPRGARVLAREVRPAHGDLRAVASVLAPPALRRHVLKRRLDRLPWLRPKAADAWVNAIADLLIEPPLRWGRSVVSDLWRSRERWGVIQSLSAAAGDGVVVEHPFTNPNFLRAVAGAYPRTGFASRDAAMDLIFGALLPPHVRRHSDKTAFFHPFFHRHSRSFVASWDGTGVDGELVDIEALRRTWQEPMVDARSYVLLQSAWLSSGTGS